MELELTSEKTNPSTFTHFYGLCVFMIKYLLNVKYEYIEFIFLLL